MINKEIEEAKSILSLFSSDEESRAYQADITYAIEGILQYIEQLENKVKEVEQVRDKLECMDYYCTAEALEDLDKILGDEGK